jgi:hypothetical protein
LKRWRGEEADRRRLPCQRKWCEPVLPAPSHCVGWGVDRAKGRTKNCAGAIMTEGEVRPGEGEKGGGLRRGEGW